MKTCSVCTLNKEVDKFSKRSTSFQSYCKSCQKAYKQKHYTKNKATYLRKARDKRRLARKIIQGLKANACMDCHKKFHFSAMDFDHRPGQSKVANINSLVSTGSISIVMKEIKKCDLVCSNCHRIRTWKRIIKSP